MRKTISLIALLLAMCFILTACGGFTDWGDEEGKVIDKIVPGNHHGACMDIFYVDVLEPDCIPLPKGLDGISVNIDSRYIESQRKTEVTVLYSDGTSEVFFISDGQSITHTEVITDVDGLDYLCFMAGDNPNPVGKISLDSIKGKDGATWLTGVTAPDDAQGKNGDFFLNTAEFDVYIKKSDKWEEVGNLKGVGIKSILPYYDPEDSKKILGLTISYSDPLLKDSIVICPGIVDIEIGFSEDKTKFVFKIFLSSGLVDENGKVQVQEKPIEIETDRFIIWDAGNDIPRNEVGLEGDFYFYEPTQTIYHKRNGTWINLISFVEILQDIKNQESKQVTVTFNAFGGQMTIPGFSSPKTEYEIEVVQGKYVDASLIPIPTRDGYTFGGWYTVPNPNTLIHGLFTNLVPVAQNITLYAYWIPNTPQQ